MTPALFSGTEAADEYQFMQTPNAAKKIDHHRKTFITEEDFIWLHDNGINAVRIPIGYWALDDAPPFISALAYLDFAMNMAKKYSLQVIIDLHGLEGSQNGRDHSGKLGQADWFKQAAYREHTLDILEQIALRYRDYDIFWGLQLINEPKFGLIHSKLRRYYHQAYSRLARILRTHTRIIFSDAFTPRLLSGALRGKVHPIVMDIHLYHPGTWFARFLSLRWFYNKMLRRKRLFAKLSKTQPIIIGEWSGVLDQAKVNAVSESEQAKLFADYIALQQSVYDETAGWFYWNYKTDAPGIWSFRSQVEVGQIKL